MPSTFRPGLAGLLAAAFLAGCSGAAPTTAPAASPGASGAAQPSATADADTSGGPVTDYADADNWMLAPATADKPVDVFYVYPTAYNSSAASPSNVGAVTDTKMRSGAQSAYQRQASAFADAANIYAPYYRQLDATWALNLPLPQHNEAIGGAPTEDVTAAFEYYLEHWNNGRPFAFAGHSQGSDVTTHLLSGYLKDHPDVAQRMIVAYVIGYSVTQDYLDANPHLRFAQGPIDTGVIVSYNTEATEVDGTDPVVNPGALAINPVTWTTLGDTAPASASKGSWLPDAQGVWGKVPFFADATVDAAKGAVIASTPDVETYSPGGPNNWPKGVYHTYDYPFYYFDLQANLNDRIAAYLAANPR